MKVKLFESSSDTTFYGSLFRFHTIFSLIFFVGLLLLVLSFFPAEAYEEILGISSKEADASRFAFGVVGFCFGIGLIVISSKMLKKIAEIRKKCIPVVEKNSVTVYEGEIAGCTCDLDFLNFPEHRDFVVLFDDIVRVQMEREVCDIVLDNPTIDVLCIYTKNDKIKVWAISDISVLVNNINTLLLEHRKN